MEYKYKLDKNRKRVKYCPCGKKNNNNKFVAYVGYENKGYCFPCDKTFYPEHDKSNYKKETEYKYIAPKPINYHSLELVSKSCSNFKSNNLIQFIKEKFGEDATKEIIKKYLIGTSKLWQGATVFWQIDNNQKVRRGKIMLYNIKTGKRRYRNDAKKESPYISSVRATLKLKEDNFKQCLFGLHLINETESKSLAIVESEKTAILMSLFKPEYIWLATGSKSSFKYKYLKSLKKYKIIGFPDKSEYLDWQNEAIELNNIGFNITVSEYLESTNYEKGTDLADVLLKEKLYCKSKREDLLKTKKVNSIKRIETSTEIIIKRLNYKNPFVAKLIETFQLTDKDGNQIKV